MACHPPRCSPRVPTARADRLHISRHWRAWRQRQRRRPAPGSTRQTSCWRDRRCCSWCLRWWAASTCAGRGPAPGTPRDLWWRSASIARCRHAPSRGDRGASKSVRPKGRASPGCRSAPAPRTAAGGRRTGQRPRAANGGCSWTPVRQHRARSCRPRQRDRSYRNSARGSRAGISARGAYW